MAVVSTPAARFPRWPQVRLERSSIVGLLMVAPSLAFLTTFVFVPAFLAVLRSFSVRTRDNAGNFTFSTGLDNYVEVFSSPSMRANIAFTVAIAVATVVVVTLVSYCIALALRFGGKRRVVRLIERTYILPLFIPSVIASYGMITVLANHGLIDGLLQKLGLPDGTFPRFVFDWKGVVITQVWLNIPFMTVLLTSTLHEIADSLVESARDVGAGSWQIFRQIVLPLSLPGASIGVTFVFLHVLGSFTIPYLLGPNSPEMLGVSMVNYWVKFYRPEYAATQAIVIFMLSLVAAIYYVVEQFKREVR